jgi:hypothetical protein
VSVGDGLRPRVGLLAALAIVCASTGCIYAEVLGGASLVTSSAPEDAESATTDGLDPGFSLGINVGTVLDRRRTARLAGGAGVHVLHVAQGEGAYAEHSARAGFLRGDVTPFDAGAHGRWGGTTAFMAGSASSTYVAASGQRSQGEESPLLFGAYVGPTVIWYLNDDMTLSPSLGAQYVTVGDSGAGRSHAVGPAFRLLFTWDLRDDAKKREPAPPPPPAAGKNATGAERDDDGDLEGATVLRFASAALDRAQAIVKLAEAAKGLGCEVVDRENDRFTAMCARGVIGFVEEDGRLAAVCTRVVPASICAEMLSSIVHRAEQE